MKINSPAVLLLPFVLLLAAGASAQTAPRPSVQTIALVNAPTPMDSESSSSLVPEPLGGSPAFAPAFAPVARTPLSAAQKKPHLDLFDWSLIGAATTLRALDYTSTEAAMARPQYFHENILPSAVVHNKAALAAFEAGTVGVNYEAYRFLVRHNRRSLARLSQYMYVGVMAFQVAHNYETLSNYPAN